MAIWPLAMWVYIFRRHDEVPQPSQLELFHDAVSVEEHPTQPLPSYDPGPALPYPGAANWAPDEPLALRQAREVVAEAEQRYPEW